MAGPPRGHRRRPSRRGVDRERDEGRGSRAGGTGRHLLPALLLHRRGEVGPGNTLQGVERRAGQRAFTAGTDFRPLAFSAAGAAAAEVVFAGYGISAPDLDYDDYDGTDVRGKVVLVLRYSPEGDAPASRWAPFMALRYKAQTARDKGARALLVVTGPGTQDKADELAPLRADASLGRRRASRVLGATSGRGGSCCASPGTPWRPRSSGSTTPGSRLRGLSAVRVEAGGRREPEAVQHAERRGTAGRADAGGRRAGRPLRPPGARVPSAPSTPLRTGRSITARTTMPPGWPALLELARRLATARTARAEARLRRLRRRGARHPRARRTS